MLNINQNFDLKAPVFNFDRDYFNSVEELNAYDTSNVPDHFVTNVAGMLYQFTDEGWIPMIGIGDIDPSQWQLNLGKSGENNCYVFGNADGVDTVTLDRNGHYSNIMNASYFYISNTDDTKVISLDVDDDEIDQSDGDSTVNMYLIDGDSKVTINAKNGLTHKTDDGFVTYMNGESFSAAASDSERYSQMTFGGVDLNDEKKNTQVSLYSGRLGNYLYIGSDEKFKFSRPTNDEGGVISGIKSLTAFADPSATKVWATDGSTVDLTTKADASDLDAKANASDVLLKKSATGGYYIEENSNNLGQKAFAANNGCTASGVESYACGHSTIASGGYSYAGGWAATASGICSHAEGDNITASGYCSHTQGCFNVSNINAIHSVGIGSITGRKNAEYIYAKNNENGSSLVDDPKNGYKYLIGVGGYDGISTDNTTYKSVQEVIADLTARIEQLETKVKALEAANAPA